MDKKHAREQVRAQIAAPRLYKVFNIAFAVVFFAVVLLAILMNPQVTYYFTWYWLLAALAAGMAVSLGVSRLFMLVRTTPKKNAEILTVAGLMVLMGLLQAYVIWGLLPRPATLDDFGMVYSSAADYALNGTLPGDYLLINPTHTGTYTLLAGLFSLLAQFGLTDFTLPAAILNVLAVDGAVLLLYFCGRRLWSARRAIFLLVVAVVTVPLLLYSPVAYSTTLALPFVTGTLLLWLKARAAWRQGSLRGAVVRFCVLSALAGAGALLKATVLIVWIAVVLDLLFLLSGKGRLRLLLAGLGCAALIFVGGSIGLRYTPLMPWYQDEGFPLRGFVMMGLDGHGGYSAEDVEAVMAQEGGRARVTFINAEIVQRLGDMGFGGVLEHLGFKIGYTYGDGTDGAAQVLEDNAGRWSSLHELARPQGSYFGIMAYLAFGMQAAMLAWAAVGTIKSVVRKNDALTFARVALFGLFLFLLVWKASPGELVPFLPLLMLCAMEASPMKALVMPPQEGTARPVPAQPKAGLAPESEQIAAEQPVPEIEPVVAEQAVPDDWPEYPEEPAPQPAVEPVVLPAYYEHVQPEHVQPAEILPVQDAHRTPTEGGWVSGLGEEYRITNEDVGLEATQSLPAVTAVPDDEPVEYGTDELEQWPEPEFPPADMVPPETDQESEKTELSGVESDMPLQSAEALIPGETGQPGEIEAKPEPVPEPVTEPEEKLPRWQLLSVAASAAPDPVPVRAEAEKKPEAPPLEAQVVKPAPVPAEPMETTASILPIIEKAPVENPADRTASYSVEAIHDALEAELTLREVLREVLPKKPIDPAADPYAPPKIGSWDPARPLPVIDDEVSQILAEISAGKRRNAEAPMQHPAAAVPSAPVAAPLPQSPAAPQATLPGQAAAEAMPQALAALKNKRFDDIEDFDISALLTNRTLAGEHILPDRDEPAADTLQQQVEAGLVQHPLAAGNITPPGARGTEVWNAKYNAWQDYRAPMWPSAPGKWEKAPTLPVSPEPGGWPAL
ncbi:hypothetical protein LJC60_06255 [Ruminococcaceae bacterium OttesenSCG-928-D13]|nr:hypothetical protein [Ruminococcaceae bacterium OttesenSCG-928-D13]